MIAKLIVYGKDRQHAIERCKRALEEFVVDGIETTIPFSQFVINNSAFVEGKYNTGYLEDLLQDGFQ